MSLGLKIIAAAANRRPIDIKKLVENSLHQRAAEIISEGYKILAAEQYGSIQEGKIKVSKHDYGDGVTGKRIHFQRTGKFTKSGDYGFNKQEVKAIEKGNKAQAKYHQRASFERFKKRRDELSRSRNSRRLPEDEIAEDHSLRANNDRKKVARNVDFNVNHKNGKALEGRKSFLKFKTSLSKNLRSESELDEGRKRLSKGTKDFNKPFNELGEPNRKIRKSVKQSNKKSSPKTDYLKTKHNGRVRSAMMK